MATKQEKQQKILLDVKSTTGEFSRNLHISMNELYQMAESQQRYDLYRVYLINDYINNLPEKVMPDGFSVNPEIIDFSEELTIEYNYSDE